MKGFIKSKTTKTIAAFLAVAVLIITLAMALALNAPTASETRGIVNVEVYGIGDDDVGFIVGDQIVRTKNESYAKDGVVHTDGWTQFTYDGVMYEAYFTSDVTQGTGTYQVEFDLADALDEDLVVYPENNEEDCTFAIRIFNT